jgi:hypothetical protein
VLLPKALFAAPEERRLSDAARLVRCGMAPSTHLTLHAQHRDLRAQATNLDLLKRRRRPQQAALTSNVYWRKRF